MIWVTCLTWSLIIFLTASIRLRYGMDWIVIMLLVIGCFDAIVAAVMWWHDEGKFLD